MGSIMEFSIKSGHPEKQRTACVVVGVYEPRRLSDMAKQIDDQCDGLLSNMLRRGDLEGKIGQTLLLHNVAGTLADRILLVGCGRERELGDTQYQKIIEKAVHTLNEMGAMETVCYLTELNVKGRDIYWRVRHAIEMTANTLYRFDQLKTKKDVARRPLRKVVFSVTSRRELPIAEKACHEAQAIAAGVKLAKDLANLPPNICTPSYLADRAHNLCHIHKNVSCEILDVEAMQALGMNALLGVAKGSNEPAKLIVLNYQGTKKSQPPIVFIGKGITFDSGGISLKPGLDMDQMKFDMCGAATVFGAFSVAAELQLPLNLVCIMPCTENLPSGHALKPGDILTSMSGQTIEILNTDAEGRLILCDALTYAERFKPEAVVDVATLTGACIVALGRQPSGLYGNNPLLINDLITAGKNSADRVWEMPLWDEYQDLLDSPFADMANIGGTEGGSITAACFLSRFAKKYHWAHLDIAGTAWHPRSTKRVTKGATGRPVPLLVQYLLDKLHTEPTAVETDEVD
jgi:leucyl aminopeptidase